MPFPNEDTQFGGPRGPTNPNGRPPGIVFGKEKLKQMRHEMAVAECVREFDDPDEAEPADMLELAEHFARNKCMAIAVRYRHPQLAASAVSVAGTGLSLEELILGATEQNRIAAMSSEERLNHAAAVLDRARSTFGTPPGKLTIDGQAEPATPASTDTSAAERAESIRQAEAEAASIRAELAQRQAANAERDHDARLRQAFGFRRAGR